MTNSTQTSFQVPHWPPESFLGIPATTQVSLPFVSSFIFLSWELHCAQTPWMTGHKSHYIQDTHIHIDFFFILHPQIKRDHARKVIATLLPISWLKVWRFCLLGPMRVSELDMADRVGQVTSRVYSHVFGQFNPGPCHR